MIPKEGLLHELNFWRGFVKTDRFLNGWCTNEKTPELQQEVADFILSVPHESILDVGSGVVSLLHGLAPNVTAVDPLGEYYSTIFSYIDHGIKQPLPIAAENLHFKEQFDIVHISNALDHSQHPAAAFIKLLESVKSGGYLIVQGFENEAVHENWQGFHQWNMSIENSSLVIEGKKTKVKFEGGRVSKIVKLENGRNWIIWIRQKK